MKYQILPEDKRRIRTFPGSSQNTRKVHNPIQMISPARPVGFMLEPSGIFGESPSAAPRDIVVRAGSARIEPAGAAGQLGFTAHRKFAFIVQFAARSPSDAVQRSARPRQAGWLFDARRGIMRKGVDVAERYIKSTRARLAGLGHSLLNSVRRAHWLLLRGHSCAAGCWVGFLDSWGGLVHCFSSLWMISSDNFCI